MAKLRHYEGGGRGDQKYYVQKVDHRSSLDVIEVKPGNRKW